MDLPPEKTRVTKAKLDDMMQKIVDRTPSRFSPEYVTEIAVAFLGPLIRESMELLAVIDGAMYAGRAQPGDQVQGGEHVSLQEHALSAKERLDRLPPKAVALARGFRDVTGKKTRSYIEGLMDGLHGELLRSRAGLSQKKHAEMRMWLHGFVQRRIGPLSRM